LNNNKTLYDYENFDIIRGHCHEVRNAINSTCVIKGGDGEIKVFIKNMREQLSFRE